MDGPNVEVLLAIDREYREKAKSGALQLIAPRRLNPDGKVWLPVLHTRYGPWRFTALFSNTERAHEMRRTQDWVVVYFSSNDGDEGQCTVVTERRGSQTGRRVVRGREPECASYYRVSAAQADAMHA
jgi:putative hydrolase